MSTKVTIQSTPNPNALKFVLDVPVKSEGNCTYTSADKCGANALAKAIFGLSKAIREVYFYGNYITITQNGSVGWNTIKRMIESTIVEKIKDHNPDFQAPKASPATSAAPDSASDLDKINAILDETVRPFLQRDGGDLEIVSYKNKNLQIFYQGACGGCPGARMGTLSAIQHILKERFDPEITVSMAD
ncbi:MAG: NifU family protein [Candidatus Omnitrophica bacterium]|nr:NifU family protein [Candidatus Omnitrophota bacterium]